MFVPKKSWQTNAVPARILKMAQALLLCVLLMLSSMCSIDALFKDHNKCNTPADMTSEHIAALVLEHGGPPALANQVAR